MGRQPRSRWYGNRSKWRWPMAPVQVPAPLRRVTSIQFPDPIVRLAGEEYERYYSQTYERLNKRGGLGLLEIVSLLADRIIRVEGLDSDPASTMHREPSAGETP